MKRKELFYLLLGLALLVGMFWALFGRSDAVADDTVVTQCSPPTHRVQNDDCIQQGTPLTAAEIESLTYTFSYRPKDIPTAPWTPVLVPDPIAEFVLPGYGVLYEVTVGANLPGGSVFCVSPPIEYRTGPDTSPPGPCSAHVIRKKVTP